MRKKERKKKKKKKKKEEREEFKHERRTTEGRKEENAEKTLCSIGTSSYVSNGVAVSSEQVQRTNRLYAEVFV